MSSDEPVQDFDKGKGKFQLIFLFVRTHFNINIEKLYHTTYQHFQSEAKLFANCFWVKHTPDAHTCIIFINIHFPITKSNNATNEAIRLWLKTIILQMKINYSKSIKKVYVICIISAVFESRSPMKQRYSIPKPSEWNRCLICKFSKAKRSIVFSNTHNCLEKENGMFQWCI